MKKLLDESPMTLKRNSKKRYKIKMVNGQRHVITHDWKIQGRIESADYLGTGAALVGVMKHSENIEDFLTRAKRAQNTK